MDLENGSKAWSFSSSQYDQHKSRISRIKLSKEGWMLPTRNGMPLTSSCQLETNVSPVLLPEKASYYLCEFERIDITVNVSAVSSMGNAKGKTLGIAIQDVFLPENQTQFSDGVCSNYA